MSFIDTLTPPFATKSSHNYSKVVGWHQNKTPVAPKGFVVTKFADNLNNPRWVYVGNNGDIFVDWAPGTNTLWTVENERDGLGDNLVPDYFTSVKEGGFYGWSYSFIVAVCTPLVCNSSFLNVDACSASVMALLIISTWLGLSLCVNFVIISWL